jgi:BirA family transcriptional regulator, biotin operon repressor / biotin---[acetyl-CoA-carboxylase] ligase
VSATQTPRPPLDPGLAAALTAPGSPWRAVEVLPESPSTNAVVADRARAGEPPGLVLVTEHQTAGRGRLDRVWVTPPRAALTFSVLLAPGRVPVRRWPWLPLLTGLAVVAGVRRATGLECTLKWPNDVLIGERKLAGILLERVERPGDAVAVVGVGINVSSGRSELPVPTATSLLLEGAGSLDRGVLLAAVLDELAAGFERWVGSAGEPAGLRPSYVQACGSLGQRVRVELPSGETVAGDAVGIDLEGRLEVDTTAGLRALGAGDVVHVRSTA